MQKKTPLTIYYPDGCVEIESIFNAFEKVYSNSITYKIKLNPVEKIKSFVRKKVRVKPFPVIHKERLSDNIKRQVPALGYNFSFDGMTICYGGDTAYCDTLVKHARNSDLAVLEAGHEEETPDEMHMTMKEAVSIGKSAKKYFLVHVPE
jgi:ribonuclease Z